MKFFSLKYLMVVNYLSNCIIYWTDIVFYSNPEVFKSQMYLSEDILPLHSAMLIFKIKKLW